MVNMSKAFSVTAAISVAMTAVVSQPAYAKIRCNGPYQIIKGSGEMVTPYCQNAYLAQVARGYGIRVSGRTLGNHPTVKGDVCRVVGYDSRVYQICTGWRPEGRR
jgi:hypothetical protein